MNGKAKPLNALAFSFAALLILARPCIAESRVRVAELSPTAEKAIKKGLDFLARNQNNDGSWESNHKIANTALGLMAFMVKGYFPGRPPYSVKLSKAVDFLIEASESGNGYMGKSMYEHGLATLALSEVWGMSDRQELRNALKKAVGVILRSQNKQGGWRYNPRPESADISVTVMQIVALASAKEAGILVPDKVIKNALKYVKSLQNQFQGGFGYTNRNGPGFARSAAGVMSLLMSGERDTRAVKAGLYYLRKSAESNFSQTSHYYYGHYYAIQAMYQAGERYYNEWYPKIRDALLLKQASDGGWSGGSGGKAYSTSMSILILGVPYRFLPIYQR
jgi:hypothetical protein